ncbi:At1g47710 [Linum grandiflorum]
MNFSIQVDIETILDQIKYGNGGAAKNIVVSPASLDILLRTAANGAKGKTLEQLLRFLGAEDIDDLNAQASKTMEVLRLASPENNPPVPERNPNRYSSYDFTKYEHVPANISCANAVWIDERYSVKDSFKKVLANVYRAETNPVDFLHQVNFFYASPSYAPELNIFATQVSRNSRSSSFLTRPEDRMVKERTARVSLCTFCCRTRWADCQRC